MLLLGVRYLYLSSLGRSNIAPANRVDDYIILYLLFHTGGVKIYCGYSVTSVSNSDRPVYYHTISELIVRLAKKLHSVGLNKPIINGGQHVGWSCTYQSLTGKLSCPNCMVDEDKRLDMALSRPAHAPSIAGEGKNKSGHASQ